MKAHILRINTSEQLAGSLFSASRQDSTESVSVQGVATKSTENKSLRGLDGLVHMYHNDE